MEGDESLTQKHIYVCRTTLNRGNRRGNLICINSEIWIEKYLLAFEPSNSLRLDGTTFDSMCTVEIQL